MLTFFLPATVTFLPLRVRALRLVFCPVQAGGRERDGGGGAMGFRGERTSNWQARAVAAAPIAIDVLQPLDGQQIEAALWGRRDGAQHTAARRGSRQDEVCAPGRPPPGTCSLRHAEWSAPPRTAPWCACCQCSVHGSGVRPQLVQPGQGTAPPARTVSSRMAFAVVGPMP